MERPQYDLDEEANTGRWSKEEHELFLRGLNEYGKDWKQIGSLIKTRTVVQIRTHAQKYFLATKKHESNGLPVSISIKPSKDTLNKKRVAVTAPAPSKAKMNKKKKEEDGLEPLDTIFDLVDAWSSGSSEEGTPTSGDDIDLFKANGFPQSFHDDMPMLPSNTTAISQAASVQQHRIPPPPPPPLIRPPLGLALHAGDVGGGAQHHQHDSQADVPATFDPLPPSLEYGLLGRWMDAMNEL